MTWVTTEAERWRSRVLRFASQHAATRRHPQKIRTETERRVLRWVFYCIALAQSPADINDEVLGSFLRQAHVRKTGVPFDLPMRSAYRRVIEEWGRWCAGQRWSPS